MPDSRDRRALLEAYMALECEYRKDHDEALMKFEGVTDAFAIIRIALDPEREPQMKEWKPEELAEIVAAIMTTKAGRAAWPSVAYRLGYPLDEGIGRRRPGRPAWDHVDLIGAVTDAETLGDALDQAELSAQYDIKEERAGA